MKKRRGWRKKREQAFEKGLEELKKRRYWGFHIQRKLRLRKESHPCSETEKGEGGDPEKKLLTVNSIVIIKKHRGK